jgi:uncharacterized cupin superfamily protein
MLIVRHALLQTQTAPGRRSTLVAGPACLAGVTPIWLHEIEPEGCSPPMKACSEQIAIVLSGTGKLLLDGAPQRFTSPCTFCIPAGLMWHVVNQDNVGMQLLAIGAGELVGEG